MAMRECCDAYGTPKGVRRYRIVMCEVHEDGGETAPDVMALAGVLCERGVNRAKGLIGKSFAAVARTPADQTEEKPDV